MVHKSPQLPFTPKKALQVALPMGGVGTGCFCLNGEGGFQDFSIHHHPAISALPDGHDPNPHTAFALMRMEVPARKFSDTRLLEGPLPAEKIYNQGLQSQGFRHGGHEGLPRFSKSSFSGGYPFGQVKLEDNKLPLDVQILGYNPFIPLDDLNSGIPTAFIEYTFRNVSSETVSYEFSFHLSHPAPGETPKQRAATSRTRQLGNRGVYFYNTDHPGSETFGSASLVALKEKPRIKAMWFRGGWFDAVSQLWAEVSSGKFQPNDGHNGIDLEGRNGGSIQFCGKLKPGASVTHPLAICWHFPNVCLTHGQVEADRRDTSTTEQNPAWRPFYAGIWKDAENVAEYVTEHYSSLRQRTLQFNQALLSSTLPAESLDAISSNLAILKSPTLLRQENGNVWGWEGCFTQRGCCAGSCTHVWNYAQSLCHLFPPLERTLRHQELERAMNEAGHVNFRAALPDGPKFHGNHAAADGQLGGLLKLYRDWHICGDTSWMKQLYPLARKSLHYAINTWDPDHLGVLVEPHHNTYDIEFWGPEPLCSGIYIAALSAMAEMADKAGEPNEAMGYRQLAERGAGYMESKLFNGEYLQQIVQWKNLRDTTFTEYLKDESLSSGAVGDLLKKEGPKYQYGSGCISDAVIGFWMAKIYGVATPLNSEILGKTLRAIYHYNFRKDLSGHANCQRPGYAIGKEAGLLLCSWPRGGKPTLPFVYSDEVWTGIEYQVASHLISEDFVQEGLTIVKALRKRYDGCTRNPFNEYECGSYYARAMASYALLGTLSGFRYSAVEKSLHFGPKINSRPFRSFFSTQGSWGTITLQKREISIEVIEGTLTLKNIILNLNGKKQKLPVLKTITSGKSESFILKTEMV